MEPIWPVFLILALFEPQLSILAQLLNLSLFQAKIVNLGPFYEF